MKRNPYLCNLQAFKILYHVKVFYAFKELLIGIYELKTLLTLTIQVII